MKTSKQALRHRVQLDFTINAYQRLQNLKKAIDAKTNAEVVRNALRILEWFVKQKQKKARMCVIDGDITKEIELLI